MFGSDTFSLSSSTPSPSPPTLLHSQSDLYLKVKIIGKKEINDKDNYIHNQLNPIFGKMFELTALLPLDHTIKITVIDWDRILADVLIGESSINIENRFLNQHCAICGLPK